MDTSANGVAVVNDSPKSPIPWQVAALAVLLASGVVFLLALGDRSLISEEVRWAEIAREMVSSGDYWHPTINGKTYFDKPVGSYWFIVGLSRLTGTVDEFTARLPPAIAGLIGVALVISLGRKIYGDWTGVFAGAILATSLGFVIYSRRATADIETVTGVLAAVWWFHRNHERPTSRWVVPLWLWMALVSLTKGLLGFALPLVIFVGFGLITAWNERPKPFALRTFIGTYLRSNRWFFNAFTLLAMPLAVAVYFTPFAMADQGTGTGLDMVWRENVKRFVAPHNHVGPIYLYFWVIFLLAAPWSLFLPAALLPRPQSQNVTGERLIRVAFWSLFLFFTASASRRSYYLLPILPYASLQFAQLLLSERSQLLTAAFQLRRVAWWLFALLFFASGLALLPIHWFLPKSYAEFPSLPARGWLAAGWGIGVIALIWSIGTKRTLPLGFIVMGVFAGFIYAFGIAYPSFDRVRPRNDFLQTVRTETQSAPEQLALFHCSDIVFDLGRVAIDYDQNPERNLADAIAQKRVRWIVVPSHLAKFGFPARVVAEEAALPWESSERTDNKLALLEFLLR